MKFHKVLKKMIKDPKKTFRSTQACCEKQSLESIQYWFTSSENDEQYRKECFEKYIKATDWKEE